MVPATSSPSRHKGPGGHEARAGRDIPYKAKCYQVIIMGQSPACVYLYHTPQHVLSHRAKPNMSFKGTRPTTMFISDFGHIRLSVSDRPVLTSKTPDGGVPRLGSRRGYLLRIEPARGTHHERLSASGGPSLQLVGWRWASARKTLGIYIPLYRDTLLPNGANR